MTLFGRVAALGRGTVDRALSRAEEAVGLRAPAPIQTLPDAPRLPFLESSLWSEDWHSVGHDLVKAVSVSPLDVGGASREPKALMHDPFQMVEILGWKERPTGLAYLMIDQMIRRTHVIQAMILTRVNQVARHCRVQQDRYGIGFRIQHRDKKKNLSRAARRMAESLQDAIMRTTTGDPGVARDDFEAFTRKVMRDSMSFDQGCWEIVKSRRGKPHSWTAVDAKTIRLVDTAERFLDRKSNSAIRTVQILDDQVINEWAADEMAFMIRNPLSSIQAQGYGTSEVEMLIHVITAILWAFQYNQKFFSQGATPKGLINFKGQVPGRQLAAFRRFFYQMLAGVENAWRTPVLNAEQGVEWISMHSTNRDMEYSAWMDFLIKLSAAMLQMDPTEIGFKYGQEGGERSMFESSNEQKVTQSKDKGLKPILIRYQNTLNQMIVQPIDPDFEMSFMGLDSLTPKEQADLDKVRGETFLTVDEIRREEGKRPLPDGEGAVILNATWMQYKQAKDAAAMGPGPDGAPPGGAPGGDAGAGGGGGDLESLLAGMGSPDGGAQGGAPAGPGPSPFDQKKIKKALTSYSF